MGGIASAVGDAVSSVANEAAGAVGSAVSSVADGIGAAAGSAIEGLSGIGSIFGDIFESVGGVGQDVLGGIGGALGDVGEFLNPAEFFQNVGGLVSDLMSGPLGDIAGALTDPLFNFANGVAGFAESVFSGDLTRVLENVITDYPGPVQRGLQESIANTGEAMNGIFEALTNLNPASPDFSTQLANLQQQVQQLGASDTLVGQMLDHINDMARRINPFQ